MKNRILIAFCAIFLTFNASSQIAVYKAKQLQAIDSIKLVNDWIKSISKDSAFVGVTDKDIPSALAVKKHLSGSLLGYVPITRTINGYPLSTNISLNKTDVGLGNVDNTSDANKPVSTAQAASIATKQATLVSGSNIKTVNSNNLLGSGDISVASLVGFTPENVANKNANNGYAGLDAGGKVPFSLLPATLMIYKGLWDATTNSPSLTNGVGTAGHVYKISNSGGQYYVGNRFGVVDTLWNDDFIIYNGSAWEVSGETNNVKSVNNQQGIVTLTTANIAENTNLYYTDSRVLSYGNTQWVRSVGGTAGKIFSSGGLNPTLTIDAGYVGQSSITNVGTITIGTWNGSAIADSYISSAATWNAKQVAYTNLSSIGSLANGNGFLRQNGSGVFSYDTNTYLTGINASLVNAVGTISNNTTGSATLWAGMSYSSTVLSTSPTYFMSYVSGNWRPTDATAMGAFLTGQTLSANITGNAATATNATNATTWNSMSYHGGSLAGSVLYTMVYDGVNSRQGVASAAQMQSFLGLNSAAYTPSTAYYSSGSTVDNATKWNNYQIDLATYGSNAGDFLNYDNSLGIIKPFSTAQIQTKLGLGSYAYRSSGLAELSGANFTGTLSGTVAAFTGVGINSTPISGGTSPLNIRYLSTGSDFYVGTEGPTAGGFFGGSSAYASVLYSSEPIQSIVGGVKRFEVNSSGISVIGVGAFSSGVTASSLNVNSATTGLGNINTSNATGGYISWQTNGTTIADIGTATQVFGSGGSEVFAINGRGARDIAFGTNNTERLRISASGLATFSNNIETNGANRFNVTAHTGGDGIYSMELYSTSQGSKELSIRFHESGQWYKQIRARADAFYFTGGTTMDYYPIYAGGGNFSGNTTITGTLTSSSVVQGSYFNSTISNNEVFRMSGSGNQDIWLHGGGTLRVVNQAYSQQLFTLNQSGNGYFYGSSTASSFIKSGGTSSQILAGDGSVITAGSGITISGSTISASGGGTGTTYTPTISNGTGASATSLVNNPTYTVVGNVVTVRGAIYVTPTAASNSCLINMTLPLTASSTMDLVGTGSYWQISNSATSNLQISITTTTQASIFFVAPATVSAGYVYFVITYSIP